ncbi:TolC family protein [Acidithiobacillus sp. CV18-2]|uniref:Protein CyaE n=1 Tax=Igneacidithiobacillus copahuensis TaxID=2724909 RepID=A0AAE2YN05_9PROT|nr:TolC family protein [Igneacidithiobacillus copahuensis]MBU2754815.1 TolC family protein [Acidithiobacillus sp. CV18-3]MBU2757472.1 TolC family protein [Acidithiobacillus sp. BN09-2]MBU2777974.1 TolC family protein [Acidithiobacillus sp. CV18-2]MBU2796315.1 TolC family protein [Acidithiobacillus sp. VAN18-2]MBU2800061.1 TolC family protein [Acidithiobacillus sp. VAN18-4]UTV81154.1 TolC family protein [Acidithiobacillus sp. YTS05]
MAMRWQWIFSSLFLLSGAAQAGIGVVFDDPFYTDSDLPQYPGQAWKGAAQQLPALPSSQDWPAALADRTWTLPELSAWALAHNPQTASAWEALRAQAAALGVAESAWLPTVTLSTNASRRQAVSTAGFSVPARNIAIPSLSLSYTLWDFGLRAAKTDAARAQEWVAGYTQNQTLQTVIFTVTQAYYQLLGDQALLAADAKTVAENQKALEAAEVLHQAGQATIGDLYQARASLASAQSTYATQEQTVRSAEGTLSSSLGLPASSVIHISPLGPDSPPPSALRSGVETLMHAAETANPALQQARAQVAVARANVRSAQAQGLPSLGVTGSYGYQFQSGFQPGDTWSVGLTLTVPLFTGFNNHYAVREAEATARQDADTLATTRNSTMASIWQDYHGFQGDLAAYPGASSSLANARKALEVVLAQYKVGQATIQDVLQADSTLAQSRYTLIANLVNSYVALAQLSQAVGMPVGATQP